MLLTNCFPSALRITSAGTPRNCRSGVFDAQLQEIVNCRYYSTSHQRLTVVYPPFYISQVLLEWGLTNHASGKFRTLRARC